MPAQLLGRLANKTGAEFRAASLILRWKNLINGSISLGFVIIINLVMYFYDFSRPSRFDVRQGRDDIFV